MSNYSKLWAAFIAAATICIPNLAAAEVLSDEQVLVRKGQDLGFNCTSRARQSVLDENPELEGEALEQKCLASLTRLFLINQAPVLVPNNNQLIEYYNEHKLEYAQPTLYSFEQHYFRFLPNATELLADLNAGLAVSGDLFAAGNFFYSLSATGIERVFGKDFANAITGPTPTGWFGPIQSTRGKHLVRVISVREPSIPSWQSQRSSLTSRWQRLQQEKWLNRQIGQMRQQYQTP